MERSKDSGKHLSWRLSPGVRMEVQQPDGDWRRIAIPEGNTIVVVDGDLRKQTLRDRRGRPVGTQTIGQGIITFEVGRGFEAGGLWVSLGTRARICFPQSGVEVAPELKK